MAAYPRITHNFPMGLAQAMPPIRDLVTLLILATFAGWLSIVATVGHGTVATIWLANGLVLGTMLAYPARYWPALCLTALAANITAGMITGVPFVRILSFGTCNLLEITAGLVILYKPGDPVEHFTERKSAVRICSGVLLAPLASCLFAGVLNIIYRHMPFWDTCRLWYVAHALGLEIMTPLALACRHNELRKIFAREQWLRSLVCLAVLIAVSFGVFAQTSYPFLFMIFPPLVLVVFVTGFAGLSFGTFFLAIITLGLTLAGHGPFMLMRASMGVQILMAQAFLFTTIIMTVPVAVALAERKRLEQRLLMAQEQLQLLAITDQLTGLSNRRLFDEFSVREWKRARREHTSISAIMIDVDMFKAYNDRYGHQSGDKCLAAVASAIGGIATRPGDLTARYGGEEFIVMLAGTPAEGCDFLAERIRRSVEALQLPHTDSPFGKVTVSVGTASAIPGDDAGVAELIETADKALYEAKRRGRNTVVKSAPLRRRQTA